VCHSIRRVPGDSWPARCGPRRAAAPVLGELSTDLAGKVKIVKLNVDDNPGTASKYGGRSIPTMILFKGGEAADMKIGAGTPKARSEEHTSELQSRENLVCRLLLEKKK